MVQWIWKKPASGSQLVEEARVRMIRETNSFLTWALVQEYDLPRIPRRLSSQGGLDPWLSRPGARRMDGQWWNLALALISLEQ